MKIITLQTVWLQHYNDMSYEINSWTIIDKYVNGKITNYFSYPTSFDLNETFLIDVES